MSNVKIPTGGRIVGGTPAVPHEYPWQAAILTNYRPYCGGCLINDQYVLTAAHCVSGRPPRILSVLLGDHNYRDPSTKHHIFRVKRIVTHSKYNGDSFQNDVALLHLKLTVNFSSIMRPPCFPRPDIDYTGKMAYVAGWGKMDETYDGSPPSVLRKTNMPVTSLNECRMAFGVNVILSSFVCAGWKMGKKDACMGDSGSALVTNRKGRWFLVGLVSWGIGCARPRYPGVYTRIDKFYNWLDVNTKDALYCTY